MPWISRGRRMLTLPWAARGAGGACRAAVCASMGIVALVVLVVGVAAGMVLPSRVGAEGLGSNDFHPDQTSVSELPCDSYGRYGYGAGGLEEGSRPGQRMNRWVDRIPVVRGAGREIVFADGDAVYAASVHGTQLWRPARESTAVIHVDGRWRYGLEGIVSFDVSRVDGALVYATCWSYRSDGDDRGFTRHRGRFSYPSGDVDLRVGHDLYELTVVRPEAGTATRLAMGNFPAWSPDGRHIAFVSAYWGTGAGPAQFRGKSDVQIMAADGTDRRSIFLPTGRHAEFPPRWSPDGTRLAFLVGEEVQGGDTLAIYTVGADGTGLQRLVEADSTPAWSPDGTRLAFVQATGDELHLYTMAADGTDVRQLTATPYGSLRSWVPALAWSPDGARLLYGCVDAICVVDLDGRVVGRVGALLTAWSADGRRIAIYNPAPDDGGEAVLASITPDGADWRVLVRAGANGGLVADQAENFLFPGPVATRAACSAGVVVPMPAQHPGLVADCETLVALRAELFGWAGTNWTTNTPLQEWEGVVVGGAPARVRELVLGNGAIGMFDHDGRLPAGMAELAFLERLELSQNGLTGSIPAAWGALSRLRWLELSVNKLTGVIPAQLGQLQHLRSLGLAVNQLSGAIPPELGQLQNLKELGLGDNQLSGAIPPELGQLGNLEALSLTNNQLTGTIPAELAQLRNLGWLYLNNNDLSGAIPAALGQLRNLAWLWLADNQLTGCIPVGLRGARNHDLTKLKLPDCEAEA